MFWKILLGYLLAVNLLGAGAVILDKYFARHNKWRIRERTLFLWCIAGGCPLSYAAMKLFHHKTRKKRFMIGVPLIFFAQLALVGVLVYFLYPPAQWDVSFLISKS